MAKLRIAEIFTSIQGEGQWLGVPSTFIRVSGCNLRCVWCDTPYASWEPEGPVREVSDVLMEVLSNSAQHIVLTGGEPMIFDPIEQLCEELSRAGKIITIETAGTHFRSLPCDLMSISPKLAHSTPNGEWAKTHEEKRLNLQALHKLIDQYDHQLKFVVTRESQASDLEQIINLLDQLPTVEPSKVMLMPEGRRSEDIIETAQAWVQTAQRYGWRLTPRWQIDLFGDTRGT